MKRGVVLVLAVLMLTLCACSMTVDVSGVTANLSPTQATETLEQMKNPIRNEMTLHVSFGPEFEIVINEYYRILSVQALNEDGQKLLSGMELTDRSYHMAVADILEAACELGFLNDKTQVEGTVDSSDDSFWTRHTKELLELPMRYFQDETELHFSFSVALPEAAPRQQPLRKYKSYSFENEYCTNVEYIDNVEGTVGRILTFHDGTYAEQYYFDGFDRYLELRWYPDGGFECTLNIGDNMKAVTEYADGKHSYCEAWRRPEQISENEYFLVDIYQTGCWADGVRYETEYYEDGQPSKENRWHPDGREEALTFYSSGNTETFCVTCPNGDYEEITYYENGYEKTIKVKNGDEYGEVHNNEDFTPQYSMYIRQGEKSEFFYTNGVLTKVIIGGETYEDAKTIAQYKELGY